MTTGQTVVAAVLWLGVGGLAVLVLLLYRTVDRAYRASESIQQAGLLPGAEAPPVEVLTQEGTDYLEPLSANEPYLLGFVSGECKGCTELLETLISGLAFHGRSALVLMNGHASGFEAPTESRVEIYPAAHPPDIQRGYGVNVVPLLYAMRDRTVLAVSSAATATEVEDLLSAAARVESEMEAAQADPRDRSGMRVVRRGVTNTTDSVAND